MEIKMRALFIGGTGTISTAITNRLAAEENWELYLINRGLHEVEVPENVKVITADINKEEEVAEKIKDLHLTLYAILSGLCRSSWSGIIVFLKERQNSLCISVQPLPITNR